MLCCAVEIAPASLKQFPQHSTARHSTAQHRRFAKISDRPRGSLRPSILAYLPKADSAFGGRLQHFAPFVSTVTTAAVVRQLHHLHLNPMIGTAGRCSTIGEAALAILARTEHLKVAELVQLRATTRHLCTVITGHLPRSHSYRALHRSGRQQVRLPTDPDCYASHPT